MQGKKSERVISIGPKKILDIDTYPYCILFYCAPMSSGINDVVDAELSLS